MSTEDTLTMMAESVKHQGPDECYPSNCYITWLPDEAVKLRASDEEIASDPPVSVMTKFKEVAEKYPDRIALVDSYSDIEDIYTYKRYYESVVQVAKSFIKLGLKSYHGVGIIGFNSPQWFISYFGTIFAGSITAGISDLSHVKTIHYIADTTKCNIIVVEDDKLLQSLLKIADDLPHLNAIIQYRGQPKHGHKKVYSWNEIMEMNVDDCEEEFKRRLMNMAPNKCCSIVSTSGTTGHPKLVMRSHDNVIFQMKTLVNYLNEGQSSTPDVSIVSYLPLSHVAGLMDIYWPIINGGGIIHFAKPDALQHSLIKTLREVRPTVFFGVPKVWEMLIDTIIVSEKQANNLIKLMTANEHDEPSLLDQLDIKTKLGLDRCRLTLIGGVPCKKEILDFFSCCGITLLNMYGLSESSGPHTTNNLSNLKKYSVGKNMPGFRTKFQNYNNAGEELLMDGRNIFMGYLNDMTTTKEVFDEEFWFRTGDLGRQDDDGFITITGRIKDLIIMSNGENIAPVPIENRVLEELPCLRYCVLIGEQKRFLSMLMTFKSETDPTNGRPKDNLEHSALEWCRNLGSNATKVSEILTSQDPLILNAIQKGIDKANEKALSKSQCIQKWMILPHDFSVIDGELGPTLKMKRHEIYKIYWREIESFY